MKPTDAGRQAGRRPRPGRAAFTLIELLVVIAIIALLVSILVPSLKRAKELAGAAICATNLKSLGMMFQLYGNDNDSSVPLYVHFENDTPRAYAVEWHRFYVPYITLNWVGRFQDDIADITSMFDCPVTTASVWQCGYVGLRSTDAYEHCGTKPKRFDYGIWDNLWGWNVEHRIERLEADQELVSEAFELNPWYTNGAPGAEGYNQARVRAPAILVPSYNVGDHHDGRVNTVYVAGNVDRVDYRPE